MKKIDIKLNQTSYSVFIGDVINQLTHFLHINQTVLIITDEMVESLYLKMLKEVLKDYQVFVFNMGNAEENKNLYCYERCVKFSLDHYLDRNLQVVAFGGGAVGDFAGFFASTYKRGVKFINVPTTLLAHDSAVGGKVAVNVVGVKNVVGTFYQPIAVIYHTEFLKTLNADEIRSGFGEVIKHDFLSDGQLMKHCLSKDLGLKEIIYDQTLIEEILYRCILIKKHYIENDIEDRLGIRQALNLGHTLAHGIEMIYSIPHGEAVLFGLCFDLFLSKYDGYQTDYQLFKRLGYFNHLEQIDIIKLIEMMKNDKKNKDGKLTFVGLRDIGCPIEIHLYEEEVKEKLIEFLRTVGVKLCD